MQGNYILKRVNRLANLAPRIAASANVTLMAPLPMTVGCRLIGRARWFPGLLDERGCRRAGPYIARAVHNPGQWGSGHGVAERALGDQPFGSRPSEHPQQMLHNRMLSLSELLGVFLAQPADNCERRELRLLCEPGFDRSKMRVELGRHATSGLIGPTSSPVRSTRLADRHRLAERLRERRRGRCQGASVSGLQAARLSGTMIDAIASSSWVARISANSATRSSERY